MTVGLRSAAAVAPFSLLQLILTGALAGAFHVPHSFRTADERTGRNTRCQMSSSPAAASADSDANAASNEVRILALHGKGDSGPNFGDGLDNLVDALSDRLGGRRVALDCPTAPFDLGDGGMAWWTLPPRVRSFNAKEYIGFEESASLVTDALTSAEGADYDLVLGHSQGAILLSALLARGDIPPPANAAGGRSAPKGYILNGAAWPNPYSKELSEFRWSAEIGDDGAATAQPPPPPCLFVIGSADNMNPPEGARRVRDALGAAGLGTETVDHVGGHSVPVRDEEALAGMVGWMAKVLERE